MSLSALLCATVCNASTYISYPSPVSAQQDCMCQGWSLMELRVRYLEISAADIQSFISCLLANINTAAFRRS